MTRWHNSRSTNPNDQHLRSLASNFFARKNLLAVCQKFASSNNQIFSMQVSLRPFGRCCFFWEEYISSSSETSKSDSKIYRESETFKRQSVLLPSFLHRAFREERRNPQQFALLLCLHFKKLPETTQKLKCKSMWIWILKIHNEISSRLFADPYYLIDDFSLEIRNERQRIKKRMTAIQLHLCILMTAFIFPLNCSFIPQKKNTASPTLIFSPFVIEMAKRIKIKVNW